MCLAGDDWNHSFLSVLAKANPIAVGLSAHKEFCAPFKTPPSSPLDLTKLYNELASNLTYAELIERCKDVLDKMQVTPSELRYVEEKTKSQSQNILWHLYRCGRITASVMSMVMAGSVNEPAVSTWHKICYGKEQNKESERRKRFNKDIQRGNENEGKARKAYTATQGSTHTKLSVSLSGLVIHPKHPFIGASPDGIVSCECCPGFGALEIKCPTKDNLKKCLDDNGQLCKEDKWYYQCQTHMLVTGASYCDLYLWVEEDENDVELKPICVRVLPDYDLQKKLVAKSEKYFLYVILPEMVARWFSRISEPRQPLQPTSDNVVMLSKICYCQTPRRDPMIICEGLDCLWKEFHMRCVDLRGKPKKKWFCSELCERSNQKQRKHNASKRRRTVSVNNENLPF